MSTMKTIAIVGVTGNQGRAVATTFLKTPGWHVRGLTRSKASSAAKELALAGVELIECDLGDDASSSSSSLLDAFRDAHVIFANTDFYALTKRPDFQELLASRYKGLPLNEACMEYEIRQGKKIVDAAARINRDSSSASSPSPESILESFVLSTLSHASKWSNGDIQNVLHFDSKALIAKHLQDEHPDLAVKSKYLQVGFYMSNVLNPILLPRRAEDGVYEFRWANVDPSTVFTAICPERDVGIFVRALAAGGVSAGTKLLAEVDPQTVEHFLGTWSEVTGRPSRLVPITAPELEAAVEAVMPSFGREMAENFQYYRDFTYTGRDPEVCRPSDLGIDVTGMTTFRQFLADVDWATLLHD